MADSGGTEKKGTKKDNFRYIEIGILILIMISTSVISFYYLSTIFLIVLAFGSSFILAIIYGGKGFIIGAGGWLTGIGLVLMIIGEYGGGILILFLGLGYYYLLYFQIKMRIPK